MKTLTVDQAKSRLGKLIEEVQEGAPVLLIHKNKLVKLERYDILDPEYDSSELEAALLDAVRGSHSPYKLSELETILGRVVREERRGRKKRLR